ncbi:MAG: hypothetical protein ACI9MR_002644, partial [Myxococcota bacterium]
RLLGTAKPGGVDDFMSIRWFSYRNYLVARMEAGDFSGDFARYFVPGFTDDEPPVPLPLPLRSAFRAFQTASLQRFVARLKAPAAEGDDPLILSCNNHRLRWAAPRDAYDIGMAELPADAYTCGGAYPETRFSPRYYFDAISGPRIEGRMQIITMPLPHPHAPARRTARPAGCNVSQCAPTTSDCFTWDDNFPWIEDQVQRGIAMAYAVGGLAQAPWDTFTKSGYQRYFGDPAASAPMYKFVRDNAPYFDGYEDGQAGGFGSEYVDDGQPVTTERVDPRSDPTAVIVQGGTGKVAWVARAVAGDLAAPIVVHLVEWATDAAATDAGSYVVQLRLDRFFGNSVSQVTLLRPAEEPIALTVVPGGAPGWVAVEVPALAHWPWALLVVEGP